jgi:hypothetical protein
MTKSKAKTLLADDTAEQIKTVAFKTSVVENATHVITLHRHIMLWDQVCKLTKLTELGICSV